MYLSPIVETKRERKWSFSKRVPLESQRGGGEEVVRDTELDWLVKNNW